MNNFYCNSQKMMNRIYSSFCIVSIYYSYGDNPKFLCIQYTYLSSVEDVFSRYCMELRYNISNSSFTKKY